MKSSKTSKRWLKEHFADEYVMKAQKEGYRSRAAYKLLEIQEKDRIIKQGMTVIDLGAAPGSWSMIAKQLVGSKGEVIALDILPMDPIVGVNVIQGDFTDDEVYQKLLKMVENSPVDLVISDMAPNISGIKGVDQARSVHLVELAWELAQQVLKPKGVFLAKVFQGSGVEELIAELRPRFKKLKIRKPKASRARSREVYILGIDFLGYNQ